MFNNKFIIFSLPVTYESAHTATARLGELPKIMTVEGTLSFLDNILAVLFPVVFFWIHRKEF
jgi:hypothetical protein